MEPQFTEDQLAAVAGVGVLIFLVIGLLLAVLGVGLAKKPLRRPGYWLNIVLVIVISIAMNLGIGFIAQGAIEPGVQPQPEDEAMIALGVVGLAMMVVYVVIGVLVFNWYGRRMIDTGGSKWWGLLGLLPLIPLIVFGIIPSKDPVGGAAESFR